MSNAYIENFPVSYNATFSPMGSIRLSRELSMETQVGFAVQHGYGRCSLGEPASKRVGKAPKTALRQTNR